MFPKLGLLAYMYPCTFLSTVLTAVEAVSHKRMNNNQDVPSLSITIPIKQKRCWRVGQWGKSDFFVLELLGPILPVNLHRLHRKKYVRNWDKSHQTASSGPLRASTTKGRSPLHFQSDQILLFPVCVLKNLMVTSSDSIHIDTAMTKTHFQVAGSWGRQKGECSLAWEMVLKLELRLTPKHAPVTFGS